MTVCVRLSNPLTPLVFFLLLLLPAGCDFGREPPGSFAEYHRTQKEVEEALVAQGATVTKKPYPLLGATNVVDFSGAEIAEMDATIDLLKRLKNVSELDLSGSTITDDQLRRIGEIATLFVLNVSNTSISDRALEYFAKHKVLTKLDVSGTNVTPKGVSAMQARRKKEMPRHPPIEVVK